ncbi:hypothetical protein PspLS_09750 [Pyricularia sp. CBS 133598]|nr:hypothetical protein PspLS_09750 [Pyricularia sp. CBS 133598]
MLSLSLLFLMTPIAVLGNNVTMGRGSIGGRCCDSGVEDPTGTCALIGMNSYGCTDVDNSQKHGCDNIPNWPTGRDVVYYVLSSEVMHSNQDNFDLEIGYIGCAE